MNASYILSLKLKMLQEIGFCLDSHSIVLDLGCGCGEMVQELKELGYHAYGCDGKFKVKENVKTQDMAKAGILREICFSPYSLPFEDNTFDFIYSHSVFEHVTNYQETIVEIARVLKPSGCCLHFFSSRYRPIEPHVFIPYASVNRSFWWLYFWSLLGVKNEWEGCEDPKARALRFQTYLKEQTNYLTRKQLKDQFSKQFRIVEFCESLMYKNSSARGRQMAELSKYLPIIPRIYSAFKTRAIYLKDPKKN